jgi:hypothetical protein
MSAPAGAALDGQVPLGRPLLVSLVAAAPDVRLERL